jgi:hypothetical protein
MDMRKPPRELDGAEVLLWAIRRRGLFHTIPQGADPTGEGVISIPAMAICRYADGDRYYLFKCDWNWEVVFDWDAESVDEAREIAATHAEEETVEWHPYPPQV